MKAFIQTFGRPILTTFQIGRILLNHRALERPAQFIPKGKGVNAANTVPFQGGVRLRTSE
jgi:hypothetical protein